MGKAVESKGKKIENGEREGRGKEEKKEQKKWDPTKFGRKSTLLAGRHFEK